MTTNDLHNLAGDLAETYINGNLSDVRAALAGLPAIEAALVAVLVDGYLPAGDDRVRFHDRLAAWAEAGR